MVFGFLKMKQQEGREDMELERSPQQVSTKSETVEGFIKTAEAKQFVKRWTEKKSNDKKMYTKRGVVTLLTSLYRIPGLSGNKDIFNTAEDILSKLGGMDGLQGFLLGWKAKSHGIMKGIKSILKGDGDDDEEDDEK